jgi:PhoPQ-activated pathogenicity-related protein
MVGLAECASCVKISAIIPLVPIVPDLLKDVHRQWQSYGGLTFAFKDYTDAGIIQFLDDEIFG